MTQLQDGSPVGVDIRGPVLLLFGPIGYFFARFYRYLSGSGVDVRKVIFPLYEFGFPRDARIPFKGSTETDWDPFLRKVLLEYNIQHVFMYGDFITPHRIAIDICEELGVESWVFELGYVRPNYVTLERSRVNSRSNLNLPSSYYRGLPEVKAIPLSRFDAGLRLWKAWKLPTFVMHAFTNYQIIPAPHKLQPKPSYILRQLLGSMRYWYYMLCEANIKREIICHDSFFLAVLQVSTDSQISLGSSFRGMHDFIHFVISSFSRSSRSSDILVFKHHPRDRGYNNYSSLINIAAKCFNVLDRVYYFHDGPLSFYLRACRGVVTVNSTVGIQAMFHSAPIKVLGQTFFNIDGLSSQCSLDDFWLNPAPCEKPLFNKFYTHLLRTTQINGNFDGYFPFKTTFPVISEPGLLSRTGDLIHSSNNDNIFSISRRVICRISFLASAIALYYAQVIFILSGCRGAAKHLLSIASSFALSSFGVRVIIDDSFVNRSSEQSGVYIWNHQSPLDILIVQGWLRIPSLTTSHLHLKSILPFFIRSARNAGHFLMDHRDKKSRYAAFYAVSRSLEKHGSIIIAPNGSLITPITERASPSALLIAKRHRRSLIPWYFSYHDFSIPKHLLYKPFRLFFDRLTKPMGTIYCRLGSSTDLGLDINKCSIGEYEESVRRYYSVWGEDKVIDFTLR